ADTSGLSLMYGSTGFPERAGETNGQSAAAERLRSGLTLEAGCGYGRFLDVVDKAGGEIVGVDLNTTTINLCQQFVGSRPRVHLVQADLFKLPFRNSTFHSIYSIGVLHHTPDCRQAFLKLTPYLASGGQISIWVYHPDNQSDVRRWRSFTTRWSPRTLYSWCVVNQAAFSWIRCIPVVRWKFSKLV